MRELCAPQHGEGLGDVLPASLPLAPRILGRGRGVNVRIPDLIAERVKSRTFFWSVELLPGTTPYLQAQLEDRYLSLRRAVRDETDSTYICLTRSPSSRAPRRGVSSRPGPALLLSRPWAETRQPSWRMWIPSDDWLGSRILHSDWSGSTPAMTVGRVPRRVSILLQCFSLVRLARQPPAFVSVTYHVANLCVTPAQGAKAQVQAGHPALELSALLQDAYGIPVLMHLAAGQMRRVEVHAILEACLAAGIWNIFALRGDDKTNETSDFQHASDLVRFIRQTFGAKFSIGVAGYPMGHPEAKSQGDDLFYLKEKIEAGADFVLTQMISTFEEIYTFTRKCNELGVKVPIIPGLYLIQSYGTFEKLVRTCNIQVPIKILEELKYLNDNKREAAYGEHVLKSLLKELMKVSYCPGAHFFTMNRVSETLGLLSDLDL